ncbi:MAG: 8-oxo-dGTP diphosphatase MutT [Rhodobacteraceae bacterium]|nr:8-oxo-dGTP diphosphatase MutT [Paracoccaceae bacterium]
MLLVSAAALVDFDGRVLISKRPSKKVLGGLWEFPGGKLELNEKPEEALMRELHEELGINTWKSCLAPLSFSYFDYKEFDLLLLLFVCRKWEGIIQPREGQELRWVFPKEIQNFPMPEADKPFIPVLRDLL